MTRTPTSGQTVTSGRTSDPEFEAILRENYRHAMAIGQDRLFANMPAKDADLNLYGELQKEYVLPFLPDLKIPILLIWATDDATVPVTRGLKLLECAPQRRAAYLSRRGSQRDA